MSHTPAATPPSKVHTFHVRHIKEGLERIKHELGPAAVILSTKKLPSGQGMEITAAAPAPPPPSEPPEREAARRDPPRRERRGLLGRAAPAPLAPGEGAASTARAFHDALGDQLGALVDSLTSQIEELRSEIRHMRLDQELQAAQAPAPAPIELPAPVVAHGPGATHVDFARALQKLRADRGQASLLQTLFALHDTLLAQGVLVGDVEALLAAALGRFEQGDSIADLVSEEMARGIACVPPVWESARARASGEGPAIHVLMGPSGVGKTTTLAKIAAHVRWARELKVGIVCADAFRIGGYYQLETYAELLDVPIERASQGNELVSALARFAGMDVVLVDTSGHSPWRRPDPTAITAGDVAALRSSGADVTLHAVVAANTQAGDLIATIEETRDLGPSTLIFTKLDEARQLGALCSVARAAGLPISLLCDGRAVPEDVHTPQAAEIAGWIASGWRGQVLEETSTYTLEGEA